VGILTEDMKRLVSEQRLGFVATVCPDGTPNLSPKGTTAVWDDDHIVFADIRSPATVSNLRRNPSTEINVVDPIVRKGYRFKGVASVVTEGALFERILDFYRTERNLDEGRTRIRSFVLVKINEAMPLISPAYDQGLTEEQVREKMQHYFDSLQRKNSTARREETDRPLPGTANK
jgi:predicted pyridoxine 5'-phosphate oxidase superfamily flavin-nucleotide-binding protein